MYANALHRWLEEHVRSSLIGQPVSGKAHQSSVALQQRMPVLVPVQLSMPDQGPEPQAIEVGIRKGKLTMRIKWLASAGANFAS